MTMNLKVTTVVTVSGVRRALPDSLDPARVAGLDQDGRIVVDDFDARNAPPPGSGSLTPHLFGLTLCCDASDKGTEGGICCRACYGTKPDADQGNYLFRAVDGTFPGLDPLARIEGCAICDTLTDIHATGCYADYDAGPEISAEELAYHEAEHETRIGSV